VNFFLACLSAAPVRIMLLYCRDSSYCYTHLSNRTNVRLEEQTRRQRRQDRQQATLCLQISRVWHDSIQSNILCRLIVESISMCWFLRPYDCLNICSVTHARAATNHCCYYWEIFKVHSHFALDHLMSVYEISDGKCEQVHCCSFRDFFTWIILLLLLEIGGAQTWMW